MELKDPIVYQKSTVCDVGVGPGNETELKGLMFDMAKITMSSKN